MFQSIKMLKSSICFWWVILRYLQYCNDCKSNVIPPPVLQDYPVFSGVGRGGEYSWNYHNHIWFFIPLSFLLFFIFSICCRLHSWSFSVSWAMGPINFWVDSLNQHMHCSAGLKIVASFAFKSLEQRQVILHFP